MPIVEESEFQAFLQNKNVVLVGPSSTMENSDLGKYIDSHDIVVRLNTSLSGDWDGVLKDFGTRTDILYHSLSTVYVGQPISQISGANSLLGTPSVDPSLIVKNKVKYVSEIYPRGEFMYTGNILPNVMHLLKYDASHGGINIRHIPSGPYFETKNLIGCHLNSGIITIVDLLQSNLKSLTILGIDFHRVAYSKYYNPVDWEDLKEMHMHRSGHDPDKQFLFFKYKIYKKDGRVKPGEKLKEFLSDKKYEVTLI